MYKEYPEFVKTAANRHNVYNETLDYINEREKAGELFVIQPEEPLPVGRIEKNPENLRKAYKIGRQAAKEKLADIIKFLESGEI